MRALQCDFTTVYYFSTRRLCLLSSSAARGRNGRARTRRQLGVSVACEIERKPAKTGNRAFPVCSYAREEGGGNGGHGGGGSTPGTKFDDQSGSPLGDRHSLLGIAITLVSPVEHRYLASLCNYIWLCICRFSLVHAGLWQCAPPRRCCPHQLSKF